MAKQRVKNSDTTRLEIRLPKETKQKLVEMCGDRFTASELLRQIIEAGEVPNLTSSSQIREKKALIEPLIIELARIGNNLNQAVKVCHTTYNWFEKYKSNPKLNDVRFRVTTLERLNDEIAELSKVREELNKLMSDLIKQSNKNDSNIL